MDIYYAAEKSGQNEIVIERSRFITSCAYVESEEDARAFVSSVKKKYGDATHNCYAYVAEFGNVTKSSDDGEPSGTAGVPILEVIKNKKLVNTCVVVTRYFGGIKLGAGGLVRAYSKSAQEALDFCGIRKFVLCDLYKISISYDKINVFNRDVTPKCQGVLSIDYGESVTFSVAVTKSGYKPFIDSLKASFYDLEPLKYGEEYF